MQCWANIQKVGGDGQFTHEAAKIAPLKLLWKGKKHTNCIKKYDPTLVNNF